MKPWRVAAALTAATGLTLAVLPATTAQAAETEERYIVVRSDGAGATTSDRASAAQLARRAGGTEVLALSNIGAAVADLTPSEAEALASLPGLVVSKDGPMEATGAPVSEPRPFSAGSAGDGSQASGVAFSWGLDRVDQRPRALNGRYNRRPQVDGQGVHAFVFDTGIATGHPEFSGRVGWGYDTVGDGQGVEDCQGHGTHVAGTVASTYFGVAPRAIVHPIRVLDCNGSGDWSWFIDALSYVAARAPGASVANASLGGPYNPAVNQAVDNFVATGTPMVVAAGNDGADVANDSPASASGAITVGATRRSDRSAVYSNRGEEVDVLAPGTDISSTYYADPNFYVNMTGTSMASPHVAGYLALYHEVRPAATVTTARSALLNQTTRDAVRGRLGGSPNRLLYTYRVAFPQQVLARAMLNATKLRVNVNPDAGGASWLVRIQKQRGARFVTVRSVRTRGAAEVVTVDVGRGRYRALVPRQFGYAAKASGVVSIRR